MAEANVKTNKKPFFSRLKKYLKGTKSELKKVTWPSKKTVLNHSLVVIVVVAVVGVVLFAMDTGLSSIIDGLVGLANKQDTADAAKKTAEMLSLFFVK
jgi:preprotein translocase subunit SecE